MRRGLFGLEFADPNSTTIHFPRLRIASTRSPITAVFHTAFHGRRRFFLLCRIPRIVRPVSNGCRSRTTVSTSGNSGMVPPREMECEFYQEVRCNPTWTLELELPFCQKGCAKEFTL